jgi:hypothetical protein
VQKLWAKSPQNGWPHSNLTIITQNSKQDDSVKAAKSDSEFLDPCRENLMPISISEFHTNLLRFAGLPTSAEIGYNSKDQIWLSNYSNNSAILDESSSSILWVRVVIIIWGHGSYRGKRKIRSLWISAVMVPPRSTNCHFYLCIRTLLSQLSIVIDRL